jgi:hypothetical protein
MKNISRNLGAAGPALLLMMFATTAMARQDAPANASSPRGDPAVRDDKPKSEDTTTKRAGEIVTQPVRDVGLSKKEIPPVLVAAVESPYKAPKGKCAAVTGELVQLNAALGPDFGAGTKENESKVGNIAAAGGTTLMNMLIPFRGLVREVSGAAPADRRLAAAVSAGFARRGYVRAYAQTKGCRIPK